MEGISGSHSEKTVSLLLYYIRYSQQHNMIYVIYIKIVFTNKHFNLSATKAPNKVQVLHISAPHAAESLVATTASQLIKDFSFEYDLIERNLWKEADR